MMYAYVRFRDDGVKVVVHQERIKKFTPASVRDFDNKRWYSVRWDDDENSGYFRAQIMKLFVTKEEADACAESSSKRFSCPQMPVDSSSEGDSAASEESYRELRRQKQVSKSRLRDTEAQFRKKQLDLLFPAEETQEGDDCLRQEVIKLRAENAQLLARIEMLEKALCSKIFEAEKRSTEKPKNCVRSQEVASESAGEKSVQPRCTEKEVQLPQYEEPEIHEFIRDDPTEDSVPYKSIGGRVPLGNNVYVSDGVYNRLMASKTDSRFVREAAVAIFSTAGLAGHSVTGAQCNRTKGGAKPALNKEKYSVLSDFFSHFLIQKYPFKEVEKRKKELNKFLAVKIADIMKVAAAPTQQLSPPTQQPNEEE